MLLIWQVKTTDVIKYSLLNKLGHHYYRQLTDHIETEYHSYVHCKISRLNQAISFYTNRCTDNYGKSLNEKTMIVQLSFPHETNQKSDVFTNTLHKFTLMVVLALMQIIGRDIYSVNVLKKKCVECKFILGFPFLRRCILPS